LGRKLALKVASEPLTSWSLTESSVVTTFLVVHFSFTVTPEAWRQSQPEHGSGGFKRDPHVFPGHAAHLVGELGLQERRHSATGVVAGTLHLDVLATRATGRQQNGLNKHASQPH
jgi:hypothetical protein